MTSVPLNPLTPFWRVVFNLVKILLFRRRRYTSMDPPSASSGQDDQQVMQAQSAPQASRHTGPLLEGEAAGPDYGHSRPQGRAVSLPLSNGVPSSEVQRPPSDMVEMESLHGSPFAAGMAQSVAPAPQPEATSAFLKKPGQLNRIP